MQLGGIAAVLYGANGGAAIGSISDGTNTRLAVNALISNPAANPANVNVTGGSVASVPSCGIGTLLNTVRVPLRTSGGSASMDAANGSVNTPVTFFYAADATKAVTVYQLDIFASSTAITFNGNTFLNRTSLGALTNGILLQSQIGGVTTTHATIRLNEDFLSQLNNTNFSAYIASTTVLLASHVFNQPLTPGSTDRIQLLVRDNLNVLLGTGILGSSETYVLQAYVSAVKS